MTAKPIAPVKFTAEILTELAWTDIGRWNRLAGTDLFASGEWMRGAASVFAPNSGFVVASDRRGQPVAALACFLATQDSYLFVNPPRLLLSGPMLRAVGLLGAEGARIQSLASRLRPLLDLCYPVAVCVSPFSPAGGVIGHVEREEIARCLVDGFHALARQWGARARAFLSVPESQHQALAPVLSEHGYSRAIMAARCVLPVSWQSVEQYVDTLPSGRRTNVRRELRTFAASGLRVDITDSSGLAAVADDLAPLFANLQRRYGHEPSVEAARDTLDWVMRHLAPLTRVILIRERERIVAFSLFYEYQGNLYLYLFGQAYESQLRRAFVYFNAVYYEPIRWAIRTHAAAIDYSNEAYEAKVLRGCRLHPVAGFFYFGGELRAQLAEFLSIMDAAQRTRFAGYASCDETRSRVLRTDARSPLRS